MEDDIENVESLDDEMSEDFIPETSQANLGSNQPLINATMKRKSNYVQPSQKYDGSNNKKEQNDTGNQLKKDNRSSLLDNTKDDLPNSKNNGEKSSRSLNNKNIGNVDESLKNKNEKKTTEGLKNKNQRTIGEGLNSKFQNYKNRNLFGNAKEKMNNEVNSGLKKSGDNKNNDIKNPKKSLKFPKKNEEIGFLKQVAGNFSFIKKFKVYIIAIGVVLALLFILSAVALLLFGEDEKTSTGVESKVSYNINGVNENTTVTLTRSNGEVLEKINFEKYILGVSLNMVGTEYDKETLRSVIILVRSRLLSIGVSDSIENTIKLTNNTIAPYWDYTKDLYRADDPLNAGTFIYSPDYETTSEQEVPYRVALTSEQQFSVETVASSVMGQYAVDSSANPISVNIDGSVINTLNLSSSSNKGTDNGSYNAILMNNFSNISKIESAEYKMVYYGDVGEFSNWKQKTSLGAPWGDVLLGTTATIDDVGCLVTSICMQIAYSGVSTGNLTNFNPGTFATAARNQGCFSSGGGIDSYSCLQNVVPNFQYVGSVRLYGEKEDRYATIRRYAEMGFFIVIEVRTHGGGQHWVALDVQNSAANGWEDIYMWDPASTKTKISDKWSYQANKFNYFKAIK